MTTKFAMRTQQRHVQPRQHFVALERLDDVVVGHRIEAAGPIAWIARGDDRWVGS
jgi:hypothetical protein